MIKTSTLSQAIEQCVMKSHRHYTEQHPQGALLQTGSGGAFFSGADSFFSQVVGWGFDMEATSIPEVLDALEDFYRAHHHPHVDIELSPHAGNTVFSALAARGYQAVEASNIAVMSLKDVGHAVAISAEFSVKRVRDDMLDEWARCVAQGFEYEAGYEQFYRYAKTPHVTPFGVFVDNTLAAGATIAIHDSICDLGVTSTLPAWRGRGLQKALLAKRLAFARDAGAEIATVTTTPGSVSDLNAQKMGFQTAYTRVKLRLLLQECRYENSRMQ